MESLTGVRMPRRPVYAQRDIPWFERIKAMLADRQTWLALFYMIIKLPLGILYFTIAITGLSVSLGLVCGSIFQALVDSGITTFGIPADEIHSDMPTWMLPFAFALGVLLLTAVMHLAKGVGMMHGHLAKALLVRPAS